MDLLGRRRGKKCVISRGLVEELGNLVQLFKQVVYRGICVYLVSEKVF